MSKCGNLSVMNRRKSAALIALTVVLGVGACGSSKTELTPRPAQAAVARTVERADRMEERADRVEEPVVPAPERVARRVEAAVSRTPAAAGCTANRAGRRSRAAFQ